MHLDGSHILHAPVKVVWNMLQDPEILARITPGIKTLEAEGEDLYKAISEVKLGPVSGSFKGKLEVVDKVAPERFTLKIKQNSKIGNVAAEGTIILKPAESNKTEVVFSGDAKLSGTLARTGQRVLSGVARTMTQQFFQAMDEEIAATVDVPESAASSGEATESQGFWARLVAWFKGIFG